MNNFILNLLPMSNVSKKRLNLKEQWRHKRVIISFFIITIVGIAFVLTVSNRWFWGAPFFNILIGTIIWLVAANLIYYEWIVYIIMGEPGNSIYRKIKNLF